MSEWVRLVVAVLILLVCAVGGLADGCSRALVGMMSHGCWLKWRLKAAETTRLQAGMDLREAPALGARAALNSERTPLSSIVRALLPWLYFAVQ